MSGQLESKQTNSKTLSRKKKVSLRWPSGSLQLSHLQGGIPKIHELVAPVTPEVGEKAG